MDQKCIQQAKPLLLQALQKYQFLYTDFDFEDYFNWYLAFSQQFATYQTSTIKVAQDASIFCFTSYNWFQDQMNQYYNYVAIPAQSSYQYVLIEKLQQKIVPFNYFSYLFLDCILSQSIYGQYYYFDNLLSTFQQILRESLNQKTLEDWYNTFLQINSNPQFLYCFITYDWNLDFINKKQILIATNITDYSNYGNQNKQTNNNTENSNNNTSSNNNNNNNNTTNNNNNDQSNNSTNCKNNNNCPHQSQDGSAPVVPNSLFIEILKNVKYYILIILLVI
ncbi:hypothetical protein ABPG72_013875 [Tetrahymena utriculariae]